MSDNNDPDDPKAVENSPSGFISNIKYLSIKNFFTGSEKKERSEDSKSMEVVLLDSDEETEKNIESDKPNIESGKVDDTKSNNSDNQVAKIDSDSSIEEVEESKPKKR